MTSKENGLQPADGAPEEAEGTRGDSGIVLRRPAADDGPAVTALIAACPPLDPNSAYCNLLQCTHFADHCVVAERDGAVVGWLSGYQLPADPSRFFLWQVAVGEGGRGVGLAGRMIDHVLARASCAGVTHLLTTITRDNEASWALFQSLSRRSDAALAANPHFERDRHFGGAHATEWQVEIGPLAD